jgi:hypothetical protein
MINRASGVQRRKLIRRVDTFVRFLPVKVRRTAGSSCYSQIIECKTVRLKHSLEERGYVSVSSFFFIPFSVPTLSRGLSPGVAGKEFLGSSMVACVRIRPESRI